jgi:hypothetical protein
VYSNFFRCFFAMCFLRLLVVSSCCLYVPPCYALLVFINASWQCILVVHQCFLTMCSCCLSNFPCRVVHSCCLLTPPCCVLLLSINTRLLCVFGAHQCLLVVLCTLVVCWCLLIMRFWCLSTFLLLCYYYSWALFYSWCFLILFILVSPLHFLCRCGRNKNFFFNSKLQGLFVFFFKWMFFFIFSFVFVFIIVCSLSLSIVYIVFQRCGFNLFSSFKKDYCQFFLAYYVLLIIFLIIHFLKINYLC